MDICWFIDRIMVKRPTREADMHVEKKRLVRSDGVAHRGGVVQCLPSGRKNRWISGAYFAPAIAICARGCQRRSPLVLVKINQDTGAAILKNFCASIGLFALFLVRSVKRRRPCRPCRLGVAWTTNYPSFDKRLGPDIAPGLFVLVPLMLSRQAPCRKISESLRSPEVFPRPNAGEFPVLLSRAAPALTHCQSASVPLGFA